MFSPILSSTFLTPSPPVLCLNVEDELLAAIIRHSCELGQAIDGQLGDPEVSNRTRRRK